MLTFDVKPGELQRGIDSLPEGNEPVTLRLGPGIYE